MSVYVTDGSLVRGVPRRYKLICEHRGYSWVECPDGTMKTYRSDQLKKVSDQ